MTTYLELRAKGEKLLAEAEELRAKELDAVVADIREKIKVFGLTPQDLGFRNRGVAPRAQKMAGKPAGTVKAKTKYRGPNGEAWSGGRGRKPRWVTEILAKGKKLEDFAI